MEDVSLQARLELGVGEAGVGGGGGGEERETRVGWVREKYRGGGRGHNSVRER